MRYSAFGLGLETTQPIPRLDGARSTRTSDLVVNLGHAPAWEAATEKAERCYESAFRDDSGRALLIIDRLTNRWVRMSYAEGTSFWLHPQGTELFAAWPDQYSIDDISSYLLGPVMALVLRLRGQICLHASAVVIGGNAVAFVGDSGSGKSTTAAACAARGYALLTDDVIPLMERGGQFLASPGYPRLRLWPASIEGLRATFKSAVSVPAESPNRRHHLDLRESGFIFHDAPASLSTIYVLGDRLPPGEAAHVELLRGHEAAIALLSHSFSSHLWNTPEERSRELTVLTGLAGVVSIRRLRVPEDLARLDDLVRAIEHSR